MLLETAKDLAYAAGKILRDKLIEGFTIEHKADIDLVTDADKAAENLLTAAIMKGFPTHGILAEEGGSLGNQEAELLWVIDPLDGTTNYVHRFPYFSVSLAVLERGQTVVGVVYNPVTDEMFSAEKGYGAWLNDGIIRVSKTETLKQSLLATGFPYDMTLEQNNINNYGVLVKQTQGVLRLGSAALDLCQVASGRLDGFWEYSLNPWDMAAGALIVAEAGGTVTNTAGKPLDIYGGHVLATNGPLHQKLLASIT